MTDQQMIQEYIAKNGVTECPPVIAKGYEPNPLIKQDVARQRREWRKEHKN